MYHRGAHLTPSHSRNADPEPLSLLTLYNKNPSLKLDFNVSARNFSGSTILPLVGLGRVKIIFNFRWLVICRVNFKSLGKCLAGCSRRGGEKQLPAASLRSPCSALLFQAVDPGAGAWKLSSSLAVRGLQGSFVGVKTPSKLQIQFLLEVNLFNLQQISFPGNSTCDLSLVGSTCRDGILLLQISVACAAPCFAGKVLEQCQSHLRDGKTPLLFITNFTACVYPCFKKPWLGCDQGLMGFCVFHISVLSNSHNT